MPRKKHDIQAPSMFAHEFENEEEVTNSVISENLAAALDAGRLVVDASAEVEQAEQALLSVADYIYAHTSLKPMSKTLFFLSRLLLLAKKRVLAVSSSELQESYEKLRKDLGDAAPNDDFDFGVIAIEAAVHLETIVAAVQKVNTLAGTDCLGLAFNTLLRGKFEGGEGLGTYLTPEEVVLPMVEMLISAAGTDMVSRIGPGNDELKYGDICGGTGRFVYALHRVLLQIGLEARNSAAAARLYDQSSLAVNFAKLNFLFEDLFPEFDCVNDSLLSPVVSAMRGRFGLLATNPPFGAGKYGWNPQLTENVDANVLRAVGMRGTGDSADPAELFLFRNLDLLAVGGALAIVLPDGVVQSRGLVQAFKEYERSRCTRIEIEAIVSLPVATFSLGGTVAKTSFCIVRKLSSLSPRKIFVGAAEHIGFTKRGNRRLTDPKGNQLLAIAAEYRSRSGVYTGSWREKDRIVASAEIHEGTHHKDAKPLSTLVDVVKDFADLNKIISAGQHFHVSVLDIDDTGFINVITATQNKPVTRVNCCVPGDILLSCINPKIWRVSVIPPLEGSWSCSPEFLVLRPKDPSNSWKLALALQQRPAMLAIQALAGGTSSSRQRVEKGLVFAVPVAFPALKDSEVEAHKIERTGIYRSRLRDWSLYKSLHDGGFTAD
jgi:type I restriction-modification system DNA methylase subunit